MIGMFTVSAGKAGGLMKGGVIFPYTWLSGVVAAGVTLQVTVPAAHAPIDPTLTGAAIATVIASISALILAVMNSRANTKERIASAEERIVAAMERKSLLEKAELAARHAEKIAEKTAAIEISVNSKASEAAGREASLTAQNVLLREMLAVQKEQALALATGAAAASLVRSIAPAGPTTVVGDRRGSGGPADPATASLEHNAQRTADNTERTADNTKRTDETIQDLKDQGKGAP